LLNLFPIPSSMVASFYYAVEVIRAKHERQAQQFGFKIASCWHKLDDLRHLQRRPSPDSQIDALGMTLGRRSVTPCGFPDANGNAMTHHQFSIGSCSPDATTFKGGGAKNRVTP